LLGHGLGMADGIRRHVRKAGTSLRDIRLGQSSINNKTSKLNGGTKLVDSRLATTGRLRRGVPAYRDDGAPVTWRRFSTAMPSLFHECRKTLLGHGLGMADGIRRHI